MGFSYSAVLVYGYIVEVPSPVKKMERACNHEIGDSKFCPECGQPAFKEVTEYYQFPYDEERERYYYGIQRFPVIRGEGGPIVIGLPFSEQLEPRCDDYVDVEFDKKKAAFATAMSDLYFLGPQIVRDGFTIVEDLGYYLISVAR